MKDPRVLAIVLLAAALGYWVGRNQQPKPEFVQQFDHAETAMDTARVLMYDPGCNAWLTTAQVRDLNASAASARERQQLKEDRQAERVRRLVDSLENDSAWVAGRTAYCSKLLRDTEEGIQRSDRTEYQLEQCSRWEARGDSAGR